MEVPCCSGIEVIIKRALKKARKEHNYQGLYYFHKWKDNIMHFRHFNCL